jgi:probable HAF family extracellular repeat protein
MNGMQNLGTLSGGSTDAFAINNVGQVVGNSNTSTGENRAFLWDRVNGMQYLCTLVNCIAAGWTSLNVGTGINSNGDNVGIGIIEGQVHGYLITTVPVPPAIWLFGTGLVGLMGVGKRQ